MSIFAKIDQPKAYMAVVREPVQRAISMFHYIVEGSPRPHPLRPELRGLPDELAADHRAFVRSLDAVYEAHKYVCRRFGGDTGTSLRTSEASALPAVDVIHALKLARTKTVRRS